MLQDGEKDVVILRNRHTYALTVHIVCGMTTADELERIAQTARKYEAEAVRITADAQIAILGIREEHVDAFWAEVGLPPAVETGCSVRPIRACMGTSFCKEAMVGTLDLARRLDEKYHGMQLPGKFEIAVCGCVNDCAEGRLRDLALVGTMRGYRLYAGGSAGAVARLGELIREEVTAREGEEMVAKIIDYYKASAKSHQRLGSLIEQKGLSELNAAIHG